MCDGPLNVCEHSMWFLGSKQSGKTMTIYDILPFCRTLPLATNLNIIINGFKGTGVYPYNPEDFQESDFFIILYNGSSKSWNAVMDKSTVEQGMAEGPDEPDPSVFEDLTFSTPENPGPSTEPESPSFTYA